jgi:hypothetical protein
VVSLGAVLEQHGINYKGVNFESLFSLLYKDQGKQQVIREIEEEIHRYFQRLELSDEPCLYDYLVLSMRSKDIIATFNWDPFLWAACVRNYRFAPVPRVYFLHGNVAIGYCQDHRYKSHASAYCRHCGQPLQIPKLLYPIETKDYANDPFILAEWTSLRNALRYAYMLTIFGYGDPVSDTEAVDLMSQAWGLAEQRELEEVEIINIEPENKLLSTWERFICSHHYRISTNFFDSWIGKHPRRSCEAMWNQTMEGAFLDESSLPHEVLFAALYSWFEPLFEAERRTNEV